ncbi:dockerin type I repeat-containing protein [Bacteroides nordii]|uniref:dockerin type I repeat-containing protein n=1 Tax=Bacteroides nordii TaxID=291645 RepID=UPI00399B04B6
MRKYLVFLCLLLFAVGAQAQFSGNGAGTANDPYQITDGYELSEVRNDLAAFYKLMNDIDLTEWINDNNPTGGWAPIGTYAVPFAGTFDGNNKCIYGLKIDRSSLDNIGLFGFANGGKISNVTLVKPIIKGRSNVGGITGAQGDITNCVIIGGSIAGNSIVGGIAGYFNGNSIIGCYCNAIVGGLDYVGGIGGQLGQGSAMNNIFSGDVSSTGKYVGGISGYLSNYNTVITDNYVTGDIEGGEYVGGIVGIYSYSNNTISNNVCIADEVRATSSIPYRISQYADAGNLAWAKTRLIQNGKEIVAEDNESNGTSYGEKTLKRSTTYIGIGWDFNNTWTITEEESYPYLKKQTDYPVVTSCEAGSKCMVKGTAPTGGKITVIAGEGIYSSTILDNTWEVSLGAMKEGEVIQVFSQMEGKLPSLVVTAVVTKGEVVTPDIVKGDANGDSSVDTADVVAIVNHILGKSSVSFVENNADLNGDGQVSVDDAVATVQLILDKQ